jgi:hypothetical protein
MPPTGYGGPQQYQPPHQQIPPKNDYGQPLHKGSYYS